MESCDSYVEVEHDYRMLPVGVSLAYNLPQSGYTGPTLMSADCGIQSKEWHALS